MDGSRRQRFNERFRPGDRAGAVLAVVAFIALALQWGLVLAFLGQRAGSLDFLRLHYTVEYGIDWVAEWWKLLAYPLIGFSAYFVNLGIAAALYRREPLHAQAVLFLTVVVEFALAGGGFTAMLLNSGS